MLKQKIRPLQLENSFLKGDINIKQEVIDSILPTYWIINIVEYQKYSENKDKKLKKSPGKNKNGDSNRNNICVTATKQNVKRCQNENHVEVSDNKTPRKIF